MLVVHHGAKLPGMGVPGAAELNLLPWADLALGEGKGRQGSWSLALIIHSVFPIVSISSTVLLL